MPTKTFEALSPSKQKRIEEAARTVFLRMPYAEITISAVVEAAAIPRGSFYQYFDDLEDLYAHLFEQSLSAYEDMLYTRLRQSEEKSVFDYYRTSFAKDYRYLKDSEFHATIRKFIRERQGLGFDIDYFERRRDRFFQHLYRRFRETGLQSFKEEDCLKIFRLLAHLKMQFIQKVLRDEARYSEAYNDFLFFVDLIERGAREESK